jgi:predicted cupin superfamily sugar epimerase
VATLGLIPHPEGGFYGEVYRSSIVVHPGDGRGSRPALTTIYFLLVEGMVSRWHLVRSDEVWHFYEGASLDLWMVAPGSTKVDNHRVGPLVENQRPVVTVPAGYWQAARSTGGYTLVGCTVGPGFDFRDFTLASRKDPIDLLIRERFPDLTPLL